MLKFVYYDYSLLFSHSLSLFFVFFFFVFGLYLFCLFFGSCFFFWLLAEPPLDVQQPHMMYVLLWPMLDECPVLTACLLTPSLAAPQEKVLLSASLRPQSECLCCLSLSTHGCLGLALLATLAHCTILTNNAPSAHPFTSFASWCKWPQGLCCCVMHRCAVVWHGWKVNVTSNTGTVALTVSLHSLAESCRKWNRKSVLEKVLGLCKPWKSFGFVQALKKLGLCWVCASLEKVLGLCKPWKSSGFVQALKDLEEVKRLAKTKPKLMEFGMVTT